MLSCSTLHFTGAHKKNEEFGKVNPCRNDISVADLKPFCELTQLWKTDYKPYVDGSKADVWMKNCKERLGPSYDKTHSVVNTAIEQGWLKLKS